MWRNDNNNEIISAKRNGEMKENENVAMKGEIMIMTEENNISE